MREQFEGGSFATTYVYDQRRRWVRVDPPQTSRSQSSVSIATIAWALVLGVAVGCLVFTLVVRFWNAVRHHGMWRTLHRIFLEGFQGGGPNGGGFNEGRRRRRSHSERLADTAFVIQSLPVEVYHSKEELEKMSVRELKTLLNKAGKSAEVDTYCEKRELVAALVQGLNSTAECCSICIEEYAAGAVLRVLRCGHRFHLECIDKWFLSSTDYTRPTACPLCNTGLDVRNTDAG